MIALPNDSDLVGCSRVRPVTEGRRRFFATCFSAEEEKEGWSAMLMSGVVVADMSVLNSL